MNLPVHISVFSYPDIIYFYNFYNRLHYFVHANLKKIVMDIILFNIHIYVISNCH
jgi:hypothetical protein